MTRIRLRTAFATRDGSPAMLLHDLRMLGLHAYSSDGDEASPPPGPRPFEIIVLEIENGEDERLQELVASLQDAVSDWLRARSYQARAERVREAPKRVLIRGAGEQTLARMTVKPEPFPAAPQQPEPQPLPEAVALARTRLRPQGRGAALERVRLALRSLQESQVALPAAA